MDAYLGEIRLYPWSWAPQGWMLCDGSLLQIRSYTALYAVLLTQYGGDGVTTFGLPDLRGRFAFGQGTSAQSGHIYTMGDKTTAENLVLAAKNMPLHTHAATFATAGSVPSSTFSVSVAGPNPVQSSPNGALLAQASSGCSNYNMTPPSPGQFLGGVVSSGGSYSSGAVSVQATGGGTTPLFPPYQVASFMICVKGYFPPRP